MTTAWPRTRSCGISSTSGGAACAGDGRGGSGGHRASSLQKIGASRMQQLGQHASCARRADAGVSGNGDWKSGFGFNGRAPPRGAAAAACGLQPNVLLARTHGGNVFGGSRPVTGASSCGMSSRHNGSEGGGRGSAGGGGKFSSTAPATLLPASVVEEATGVRLCDDQLRAVRGRYQSGSSGLAMGIAGRAPNQMDLRQEVFSSIVLRPGQFPNAR